MVRRRQILVVGSDGDHCSKAAYQTAYKVGAEVGKQGAVLVSGGLGGVMEAASHGAADAGGTVIGIIPQEDKTAANYYCDVVIATGLGSARDFLTAYSSDAIIVVEGGAGTLIEVAAGYQKGIPIVALKGSGGVADKIIDTYLDERKLEKIVGAASAEEAVRAAVRLMKPPQPSS